MICTIMGVGKDDVSMKLRRGLSLLLGAVMSLSLCAALTATADGEITKIPVTEITFDNGTQQGIYSTGNSKARLVSHNTHSGGYALEIYNRDQTWNSGEFDMTGRLLPGNTYRFSAWLYQETGKVGQVQLSMKYLDGEGTDHYDFAVRQDVPSGEWTYLIGKYTVPDVATAVYPYIELISSTDTFRMDDVTLVQTGGYVPDTSYEADIVSLKEAFASSGLGITVGASIGDAVMADTTGNQAALITKHFDAISLENQLKTSYLLDYDACIANLPETNLAPALDFSAAEPFMDFAKENGLKVKAQCLAWFSMTPEWYFHVDYDETKPLVDRDTMLARVESYVKDVLTWGATEYPGVIDMWIVVNEAFDGDTGTKVRNDNYFKTIGEDYIAKVFEFANKYRPEGVTYLYNDYNMEAYSEKIDFALQYLTDYGIIEKGWVDGIGFQCHLKMDWPGTGSIVSACEKVAARGLEAQVTEIDIALGQSQIDAYGGRRIAFRAQQKRYEEVLGAFFTGMKNGLDLTNITWWGLTDQYTWLTSQYGESEFPLLFDENNKAKPAFYGVLNALNTATGEESVGAFNLALGKETGDNGHQGQLTSDKAVDGIEGSDPYESRWAGKQGTEPDACDDFWWVDFGEEVTFNNVQIKWEVCHGKDYTIEVKPEGGDPTDTEGWTVVATVTGNNGSGWREVILDEAATGRYMRVNITKKANVWGVSFWEIGVYNDETLGGETLPPVYIGEDTEEIPNVVELPKGPMPGDMDGSGDLTAADLTKLARGVADIESLPDNVDGDMDGDGQVNAADLTKLARLVAGIDLPDEPDVPLGDMTNVALSGTGIQCESATYQGTHNAQTLNDAALTSGGYQPAEWKEGDWCGVELSEPAAARVIRLYWESASYISSYQDGGYNVYFKVDGEWVLQTLTNVVRSPYSGDTIFDVATLETATLIEGVKVEFLNGTVTDHKYAPKLYELEILA